MARARVPSCFVLALCLGSAFGTCRAADAQTGSTWGSPITLETGADNGFLDCAAGVLHPDFRNGNTDQAFSNLASKPSAQSTAVLSGHGNSGLICTGNGDQCGAPGTIIGNFNVSAWDKSASKIADKFSALRLLGCDVGSDQSGADFLFAMAKIVHRPVSGPTYLVWCGGGKIWLDEKATWQQATPTSKPTPIPKPSLTIARVATYRFKHKGEMVSVSPTNVRVLRFQYRSPTSGAGFRTLDGEVASRFVGFIDFARPFEPGGVPAAVLTASADLEIRIGELKETRKIGIYNDELAEDLDHREVFYHVDSRLRQQLEALRLER